MYYPYNHLPSCYRTRLHWSVHAMPLPATHARTRSLALEVNASMCSCNAQDTTTHAECIFRPMAAYMDPCPFTQPEKIICFWRKWAQSQGQHGSQNEGDTIATTSQRAGATPHSNYTPPGASTPLLNACIGSYVGSNSLGRTAYQGENDISDESTS